MNLIDSSAWLEYLADGPHAGFFASPIENPDTQIVPTPSLFEVYMRVRQQRDEESALRAVALMQEGTVVDLDATLALEAASLSVKESLPLADSVILATARAHGATLWTQDADFEGLPGVRLAPREP